MSLVAGSATPTLATWTLDQSTKDAIEICDRSFKQDNADIPFMKKSTSRALYRACTYGIQYGHEAVYEPYEQNERETENKDYPIAVPPLADFREDYKEGIQKCLVSGSGYPDDSQLQERMACMDGFDAFAGNIAALHPDVKVEEGADFNADHEYFEGKDYLSVYQDIQDNRTWAYVLADRTFHPNHYPGYRRDMLFAPKNLPDDVKDKANAALMAMNQPDQKKDQNGQPQTQQQQSSGTATQASNNNFWFWYWYWYHYNSHSWWSSPSAYSATTTYRRDTGPRMEYSGAQVSGPPSPGDDRRAAFAGGGGGGSAAYAGGRASTAYTGSNASPSPQFGTRATGAEYSKASPWSTTKLTTTTSGQLGTARGFIVRGGLGAYGGYANRADGARAGSIPKASTPTFNTYTSAARGNFSSMGSGKSGTVSVGGSKTGGSYGGSYGGGSFGKGGSVSVSAGG